MASNPTPEGRPIIVVEMTEWDRVGPEKDGRLSKLSLSRDAAARATALRDRLSVGPGFDGLEITSTSFVGRVDIGPLRVVIRPKLPAMPLTRLLRYAYDLRDLRMTLDGTEAPMARLGLHDILVIALATETEELLHRGLVREYVNRVDALNSPRGRILFSALANTGGVVSARLPCSFVERQRDWPLNQVVRAGLDMAGRMTSDTELRRRTQRLAARIGGAATANLHHSDLDRAEQGLTRITASYAPALALIKLLLDAQGLALEPPGQMQRVPGFLFDMSVFFQRLLSRFLHDHLPAGQRIEDERTIRGVLGYAPGGNPRKRAAPRVRPDYALHTDGTLRRFLDAKYRDAWDSGCPAAWLQQLAIYALASPDQVSVLLYATMAEKACEERLHVRASSPRLAGPLASIVLRPVRLAELAELVGPEWHGTQATRRRQYADALIAA